MKMAAGREHGQSDRSRNSSWREASLPKERRGGYQGRTEHFKQGKILWRRYYRTSTTTTLPQEVSSTQKRCFYFDPRRNLAPLPALKRSRFYCSLCPFQAAFSMPPLPHLDFRACSLAMVV